MDDLSETEYYNIAKEVCSDKEKCIGFIMYNFAKEFMKRYLYLFVILFGIVYTIRSYGADNFNDFDVHYQLGNEYNNAV